MLCSFGCEEAQTHTVLKQEACPSGGEIGLLRFERLPANRSLHRHGTEYSQRRCDSKPKKLVLVPPESGVPWIHRSASLPPARSATSLSAGPSDLHDELQHMTAVVRSKVPAPSFRDVDAGQHEGLAAGDSAMGRWHQTSNSRRRAAPGLRRDHDRWPGFVVVVEIKAPPEGLVTTRHQPQSGCRQRCEEIRRAVPEVPVPHSGRLCRERGWGQERTSGDGHGTSLLMRSERRCIGVAGEAAQEGVGSYHRDSESRRGGDQESTAPQRSHQSGSPFLR